MGETASDAMACYLLFLLEVMIVFVGSARGNS